MIKDKAKKWIVITTVTIMALFSVIPGCGNAESASEATSDISIAAYASAGNAVQSAADTGNESGNAVQSAADTGNEAGNAVQSTADTGNKTGNAVQSTADIGNEAGNEVQPAADTSSTITDTSIAESSALKLGDEQFDLYLTKLEGKKVAIFSNQTGIVGDKCSGYEDVGEDTDTSNIPFGKSAAGGDIIYGEHIVDALLEKGVNVTAIFSPEHGFRGIADAGDVVSDSVDEKTGIPILSLYGINSHYPSAENMEKFDILVVDIQDVGLRYYTYYISMYYLMDACASAGKEVVVFDRPNPNGFYVDGPILEEEYASGVGLLPIPIVHGMTIGELALMINGEGWLEAGKDACALTVIPCQNYTHDMKTSLICRPSPNLKDMRAIYLYASTCFFENTAVSVGRGTEFPFEIYGSPYAQGFEGYDFAFVPKSMEGAVNPPFMGKTCYGVDLRDKPIDEITDEGIQLRYLVEAYGAVKEISPSVNFWGEKIDEKGHYWIDLISGSDELRTMIEEGKTAEEIKASWQDDIEDFKKQRINYLLYE